MRFNCPLPETWEEKKARLGRWRRKFAWLPVRIGGNCYWLEFVERRGEFFSSYHGGGWVWEYRNSDWDHR